MAAITCARTLVQAGHRVTVFEKSHTVGGRMATRNSPFGTFDTGAQYFTVRDPRFVQACKPRPTCATLECQHRAGARRTWPRGCSWPARARAPLGGRAGHEHWYAVGHSRWWTPRCLELNTRVTHIERDTLNKDQWQLRTTGDWRQHPCVRGL
jgi:renalase